MVGIARNDPGISGPCRIGRPHIFSAVGLSFALPHIVRSRQDCRI